MWNRHPKKKLYKLENLIDGKWWAWGAYASVPRLVEAAFQMGRGTVDDVRVTEIEADGGKNDG